MMSEHIDDNEITEKVLARYLEHPEIYEILIRMFFRDTEKHHLPHIHADYQGKDAVYSILDGTVPAGNSPSKKHKLDFVWIEIHQEDLLAGWDLAVHAYKQFPN